MRRWLRGVVTLFAFATVIAPGVVRADTGASLPQGYTSDIATPGAPAVPAPSLPVRQVDDGADDASGDADDADDEYADNDPSALTDFREPLAPYGAWVDDATYGTVWVPNSTVVGADFAPYQSAGHWALTDEDEWMWVSDYDWGYVPFHYGRWLWINGRGWSWIPGRTYAPAWVSFRVGDDGYVGWAPMPPTWYWSGGVATNLWVTPYAAYCFVPTTHVFHNHVHNYVVRDVTAVRTIAAGTRSYTPARPRVVSSQGSGGQRIRSGSSRFKVASPSLADAHISAASVPTTRTSHDTRARAFATRRSTAEARRAIASGRGIQGVSPRAESRTSVLPMRRNDFNALPNRRESVPRDSRAGEAFSRSPREAPSFDRTPTTRPVPFSVGRPSPQPALPSRPSRVEQPRFVTGNPSRVEQPRFVTGNPSRVSSPSHFSTPRASAPVHMAPATVAPRSFSSGSHSSGGGHYGGGRHR